MRPSARWHPLVLGFALLAPSPGCAPADSASPGAPCQPQRLPSVMEGLVGYAITANDEYESTGCALFDIELEVIPLADRSEVRAGLKHFLETAPETDKILIGSREGIFQQRLPPGEYLVTWTNDSLEALGVPPPPDTPGPSIRGALVFTQQPGRETLLIARAGEPVVFFLLAMRTEGSNPELPPWE